MSSNRNCVLGIDVGTTSMKVCLVEIERGILIDSVTQETKANVQSDVSGANEQDVESICGILESCVSALSPNDLQNVKCISVCGQMHGCVLWKKGKSWKVNEQGRFWVQRVSRLYTWQDKRCSAQFLNSLPKPDIRLSTGHGCATLLWLCRFCDSLIKDFDQAGTVQDFIVAMLCDLDVPVMSNQNAAGWGYFNIQLSTWNTEKLKEAGLPLHFLPKVVSAGSVAGLTKNKWCSIPSGTPVLAAFGDMQCSVFSTMIQETDAVLNISTSTQLSMILPKESLLPDWVHNSSIECRPFFQDRFLAVAASLNGGNVLTAFVEMLQNWTRDLGVEVSEEQIWEKLLTLGEQEQTSELGSSMLNIVTTLYGERQAPDQRASVHQIETHLLSLGRVFRSLCRGLIQNLHSMMPAEYLVQGRIKRILGTGSALVRNKILQAELERQYSIPVEYVPEKDAATGAALAALKFSDVFIN